MRRNSRELAFKLIYENLFLQNSEIDLSFHEEMFSSFNNEEVEYGIKLFNDYNSNKDEISKKVSDNLKNYDLNRVYKIDLAILYLVLTEIKFENIPKAICVNEGLEIAKIYSTENSAKFINGVLKTIFGENNDWWSNFSYNF